MTREFNVVIQKDEDGYFVATVPELRGCHTQAKSLDVLMRRIEEAIKLCLEVEEPLSNEFVGIQRVIRDNDCDCSLCRLFLHDNMATTPSYFMKAML